MKKLYLFIFYIIIFTNCSDAQSNENKISIETSKKAAQHNDKLVLFSSPIIENINSLNTQLLELTLKKEHNLLIKSEIEDFLLLKNDLKVKINLAIDSISNMDIFDQKMKLKECVFNRLLNYRNIIDNDYPELISILLIDTNVNNQMIIDNEIKILDLTLRIIETEKNSTKIQSNFADKYNFQLVNKGNTNWELKEQQVKEIKSQLLIK